MIVYECFSGTPRLWLRGAGASSWVTAGSTAVTEICLPITQHTGRQASSQVPCYMVLNPTAPTKALWIDAEGGCWSFIFGGRQIQGMSDAPICWLHFLLFSLETSLKLSLPWFNVNCFLELCLAYGRPSNVPKDESKFQNVVEVFNLQNQMPLCTYIFCNILMCKLI